MIKAYRQTSSQNLDIDVLSRSVRDYTEQLTKNPTLDGVLLKDLTLSNSLTVPHTLERPWVGYIVTNQSAFANIRAVRDANDAMMINLESNTPVKVDVWVF